MGRCVNTGHKDKRHLGERVVEHWWYGRLNYGEDRNFTLVLCFGQPATDYEGDEEPLSTDNGSTPRVARRLDESHLSAEELAGERTTASDDRRWQVPDEWCNCETRFSDIPRFGMHGIGPYKHKNAEGKKDSQECHRLLRVTPSRLTNSTDVSWSLGYYEDKESTNIDCRPNLAPRCAGPALAVVAAAIVALGLPLL
mmetsp:Transcript_42753/g.114363  ORF Transcript_42753/g.114363 Transcript_42753/m.114363 type:complete len:197 (-) Transcript_42753:58-648(-)